MVFRVSWSEAQKRVSLTRIGVVKHADGAFRVDQKTDLNESDRQAVQTFVAELGTAEKSANLLSEALVSVGQLAQWVQSEANDAEIAEAEEQIFLALHDVRVQLQRRLYKA